MNLTEYYEKTAGRGVLATANTDGKVYVAYYARPHVIESETVAFIMKDRRSHTNIIENPNAAYLFTAHPTEQNSSLNGIRLYLTMIDEEMNTERLYKLKRRNVDDPEEKLYLVFFHVDTIRPLVGDGDFTLEDGVL